MDGENHEDFRALHGQLTAKHQPATPTEQILVERMVMNQWLTLRAVRLQNRSVNLAKLQKEEFTPGLPLFIRYQHTAERAFDRAHNELLKAQKERTNSAIGFEPQNAAAPAGTPAGIGENTPQSAPITAISPEISPEPVPAAAPEAPPIQKIAPEPPDIAKMAA
jgi:hypothetical protein